MSLLDRCAQTLYVTAQGLIALTHHANRIEVSARFEAPEEEIGHSINESQVVGEFRRWVEQRRHDVFVLLIDHVDEQQLIEEIPRLGRKDRESLIAKRAAQRFRDCEFTTHQLLEKTSDQGRKQHRIAMMALKSSVPLAHWLEVLLELQVRIRRITSPSLLADPLTRRLAPGQTGLLVSHNPAGLRQTLLVNGNVRFSRLARLAAFEREDVSDEIQRSLQYLVMTQRLTRAEMDNHGFGIWVIDDGIADAAMFPAQMKLDSGAEVPVRLLNPPSLGLASLTGHAALGLWAGTAMRMAGQHDYGNPRTGIFDRIHQWKIRLWSASIAVAVTGALMTVFTNQAVDATINDTRHIRVETASLSDRIRQLEQRAANLPLPPVDLISTVAITDRLRAHEIDPFNLVASVAAAWRSDNGLILNEFAFEPLAPPREQFAINGLSGHGMTASSLLNGNKRFIVAGSVDPTLTRSEANRQIQRLAARLERHCECNIDQVSLPHDPAPESGMSGPLPSTESTPGEFRIIMHRQMMKTDLPAPDQLAVHNPEGPR